jgi:hypothetical protein
MKLVKEGKLSPEDAAELIEAFTEKPSDEADKTVGEAPEESPFGRFIGSVESLTREVSKSVDWNDVAKQIRVSVQKGVEAIKTATEDGKGKGWGFVGGQQAQKQLTLPLNLEAGKTFKVDCANADVTVEGGHLEGRVEVTATFRAFTQEAAQEAADAFNPMLEEGDSFAGFRCQDSEITHAEIKVYMPAGVHTEVKVASGDTSVSGTKSSVRVNSASGDVVVKEAAGSVDLHSLSGDILLENTEAAMVTAESKSGDVRFRQVAGLCTVRSTSGEIKLAEIDARTLSVESTSGDVMITLKNPVTGTVNLRTVSGDVQLDLPDGSDARVSLSSVSGEVSVDKLNLNDQAGEGHKLTGKLGHGEGTLDLSSVSGDIRIGLRDASVVG